METVNRRHAIEPWMVAMTKRYPGGTMAKWVDRANGEERAALSREYPGEDVDALMDQGAFIDAVDEIRSRDDLGYGEAMERAMVEHPEAYEAYQRATGRRLPAEG